MDSHNAELLSLKEVARTARDRFERLSNPTRGYDRPDVIKHAEDLWLEAAAAIILHEDSH